MAIRLVKQKLRIFNNFNGLPNRRLGWSLVAAAVLTFILSWAGAFPSVGVEVWYARAIFPRISGLAHWFADAVPFAWLDAGLPLGLLLMVFLARKRRFRLAANVIGGLYLIFFWSWGLNYHRQPLASKLPLDGERRRPERIEQFAQQTAGRINRLYAQKELRHYDEAQVQAEAVRREMMAIAERSRNPYCIMIALGMGAALTHDCGRADETLELSERLIALTTEQRMYFWLAIALCHRGGALVQRGEVEAGIEQTRQGLDLCATIGIRSSYSYYLTYLASAYLDAGKLDEGLTVVDEGFTMCRRDFARFHEPELWRLKGELLGRRGEREAAEAALRRALDGARQEHGKALELRATMSLARLLRGQGKGEEARSVLAGIYGWFTEGFDTCDLRQARALLAELG